MRVIAGKFKRAKLILEKNIHTRPTKDIVKESIFNAILAYDNDFFSYDLSVLDLFAGTGALGIEALSRGANKLVFVDSNKLAINLTYKNLHKLRILNNRDYIIELVCNDIINFKFASNFVENQIKLIFLDPPYKTDLIIKAIKLIIINKRFLHKDCLIVIESDTSYAEFLKQYCISSIYENYITNIYINIFNF